MLIMQSNDVFMPYAEAFRGVGFTSPQNFVKDLKMYSKEAKQHHPT